MELSYNELVQLEEAIRRNLAYTVEELNRLMEDVEENINIAELEATTSDLQSTTTLLRKTQQALKAYETEEQTDATEQ